MYKRRVNVRVGMENWIYLHSNWIHSFPSVPTNPDLFSNSKPHVRSCLSTCNTWYRLLVWHSEQWNFGNPAVKEKLFTSRVLPSVTSLCNFKFTSTHKNNRILVFVQSLLHKLNELEFMAIGIYSHWIKCVVKVYGFLLFKYIPRSHAVLLLILYSSNRCVMFDFSCSSN